MDFQTAQRLDARIPPQITASDDFFTFLFSASGTDYATLRTAAEKQEPLPNVALSGISITINVDAAYDVIQTRLTRNVVGLIEGSDSSLRDTYVLLGAHYDHIGYEQFAFGDRRTRSPVAPARRARRRGPATSSTTAPTTTARAR